MTISNLKDDLRGIALKEIFAGAGITFGLGLIGYVLVFVFKIIAARYFGPANYGMYEFLTTIVSIGVVITSMGIPAGLVRFYPEYSHKKEYSLLRGYLRFALSSQFFVGLLLSFVLYASSSFVSSFFGFGADFAHYLQLFSFLILVRSMISILSSYLQAKKKAMQMNFGTQVLERLGLLTGAVILIQLRLSFLWLIYLAVLSAVISLCFYIITYVAQTRTELGVKAAVATYDYRDWLSFSLPLVMVNILGFLMSWTDQFVIAKFLNPAAIGIYGVSFSLANYVFFIPTVLLTLFVPVLVELFVKDKEEFLHVFDRVKIWSYVSALFIGIILMFFAKQILFLFFGASYVDGTMSVIILSASFIFCAYFTAYDQFLIVIKKSNVLFVNTLLFAILNLVGNILIVRVSPSISSVALVSAASLFLSRFSVFLYSRRKMPHSVSIPYLIRMTLIGGVAILLIKLLFVWVLNSLMLLTIYKVVIAGIVYAIVFFALIILTKSLVDDDKQIVDAIFRKVGIKSSLLNKIIAYSVKHPK